MTKETFLRTIQSEAQINGSNAARAWEHAISTNEKDNRWNYIKSESMGPDELVWQYCKFFGVEYKKPVRRNRKSQVERWTRKLAEAKALQSEVKPEHMTAFLADIADLEAKLAHAIKNNL